MYLFILCCTDINLKVNKNVKECLQIVLENVDDNWNLVYEDGEMKVWAAINFHYIDTDEIPGFFLLLKNHIFIACSEHTIFIFYMWGYWCCHGY